MSTNNNYVTLNISVDAAHLAQLERIAELCERINGRGKRSAVFTIKCGEVFLQPTTINNAVPTSERAPLATEASIKAASDAARSTLEWISEMAASAAETDKRLAAAKQQEAEKAKGLECRLARIETLIDHCMANISSLRSRDSLV
ncbi:TPA: hypothetical protein SMF89_004578 [Serratia marcescens]|nr:hypothetical protein [Serratia marcescens]